MDGYAVNIIKKKTLTCRTNVYYIEIVAPMTFIPDDHRYMIRVNRPQYQVGNLERIL